MLDSSFSWSYCLQPFPHLPFRAACSGSSLHPPEPLQYWNPPLDGVPAFDPVSVAQLPLGTFPPAEIWPLTLSLFLFGLRHFFKALLSYCKWLGLSTGHKNGTLDF